MVLQPVDAWMIGVFGLFVWIPLLTAAVLVADIWLSARKAEAEAEAEAEDDE